MRENTVRLGPARYEESTGIDTKLKRVTAAIFMRVPAYFILVFLVIPTSIPLLWTVLSSFKTNTEILSQSLALPARLNLDGYQNALVVHKVQQYFVNSLVVSVGTIITVPLLATLAAYPIARFSFPGRDFLGLYFALGILIPGITLAVPEVLIIKNLGLLDTKAGLCLMYSAVYFPISCMLLRSFFLSLPKELEEAARIDGAGFFRTLVSVVLPVSIPGLMTVVTIIFIWSWNEFFWAFMLTGSASVRTMTLAIRSFLGEFAYDYPGLFASVTIAMLPPLLLYTLCQEQVVAGLTAGAVKG